MITYKVTAKYQKGPETAVAKFEKLQEAQSFIQSKLREDNLMKVMVIYNLYELGELIGSFDQSHLSSDAQDSSSDGAGQQQSSSQRFSPNPLQTNLRPAGLPPSSFVNDDDTKKS